MENLAANVVDFNVTLVIISDLDTTKKTSMITLYKPDPIPEGPDVEEVGWLAANYLLILVGVAFIGGILFASFTVMRGARAPLEEYSSLDGYRMTVEGWDGTKSPSEELPSADGIANSMYGGTEEMFQKPPPPSRIPDTATTLPMVNSGPPVPEEGLPEGWTMEQWQYYGQEWLDSQK